MDTVPTNGTAPESTKIAQSSVMTKTSAIATLVTFVAALLALAVFIVYSHPAPSNDPDVDVVHRNEIHEIAATLYDSGDTQATIASLQEYMALDAHPEARARAARLTASSYFDVGGEENEARAIELLKQTANDPAVSSKQRARTMTALISAYYIDRSKATFDKIFSGPPFGHLAAESDRAVAVRKAAELSHSIYPTTHSAIFIAMYHAGQLLDNDALTAEERAVHKAEIESRLAEVRALIPQEGPWGSLRFELVVYHWLAFHTAVLALEDEERYRADFEKQFNDVIDRIRDPKNGAVVLQILPYSLFYYAAFLNEMDGAAAKPKIEPMLEAVIVSIEEGDPVATTDFLRFMAIERDRPVNERDHNYRFFTELAALSPNFKDFLMRHGWTL